MLAHVSLQEYEAQYGVFDENKNRHGETWKAQRASQTSWCPESGQACFVLETPFLNPGFPTRHGRHGLASAGSVGQPTDLLGCARLDE